MCNKKNDSLFCHFCKICQVIFVSVCYANNHIIFESLKPFWNEDYKSGREMIQLFFFLAPNDPLLS